MHSYRRFLKDFCFLLLFLLPGFVPAIAAEQVPPVTDKLEQILTRVNPVLHKELAAKGLQLGAPVFLRIFKLPGQLEVWVEKNGTFKRFKTYPICDFSGFPGPKLREGDWQSPEGFYRVTPEQMNPNSRYHLSFNIGYPNKYDMVRKRTGNSIMVHGSCSSMGCFAMNNFRMEEIYALAHNALANGQQSFAVHIFPFPMTAGNMVRFRGSPWIGFWKNLKEGFDAFEQTRKVPEISVTGGRYIVQPGTSLAMKSRK